MLVSACIVCSFLNRSVFGRDLRITSRNNKCLEKAYSINEVVGFFDVSIHFLALGGKGVDAVKPVVEFGSTFRDIVRNSVKRKQN